jgi:3-oxoacyl-[acyl-carrier protein] reductase
LPGEAAVDRETDGPGGDRRLAGRNVLVTGASSGIGRAIALACARAGANLAVTYRRNRAGADETAAAVRTLGCRAEVLPLDLTDQSQVNLLADRARAALGRVDVWINNAGADILTAEFGRLPRLEKLELVLKVDLRGTILASWAAVELMQAQPEGGTIINMSWDHVSFGMEGENPGLYAAAKGGILSFSKSLAREVAPRIRVNVLAPGFIETAFGEVADREWHASVERRTPLGRWGTPDDVAAAAVFLASAEAAFLTGQTIMVNGGVVMSGGSMPATKERTYNENEIAEKLKALPGWYYEDGWIRRVYKTDGWPTTMMLVNTVGYLAEAAYHHPDLAVTWGRITVKLQNHAAGGITDKDFELARKIEEIVLWRPSGGALEGTPNKWVRPGDPR